MKRRLLAKRNVLYRKSNKLPMASFLKFADHPMGFLDLPWPHSSFFVRSLEASNAGCSRGGCILESRTVVVGRVAGSKGAMFKMFIQFLERKYWKPEQHVLWALAIGPVLSVRSIPSPWHSCKHPGRVRNENSRKDYLPQLFEISLLADIHK